MSVMVPIPVIHIHTHLTSTLAPEAGSGRGPADVVFVFSFNEGGERDPVWLLALEALCLHSTECTRQCERWHTALG